MYESVFANRTYLSPNYRDRDSRVEELWPWVLLGLLVYLSAALVLARRAAVRFRQSVRGPVPADPHRPRGRPAPPELATSAPSVVGEAHP
jgi:hypothetical protein